MAGAAFNRGASEQGYATPWEFVRAVEKRIGRPFDWDLAAVKETAKAPLFIAPPGERGDLEDIFSDAAMQARGLCWLNPPFGSMKRWSARAAELGHPGRQIVMLAPASVSTDWFAESVWPFAYVIAVRPRIKFVGEAQGFPKDLMIALYGFESREEFSLWRWDGA